MLPSARIFFTSHRCVLLWVILLVGCRPQEQIKTTTIPSTSPPQSPLDAEAIARDLDHILVATLPQKDTAWFFKLVGKAPAVARQREAFNAFLATIKLPEESEELPSWDLPAGWSEEPAPSKFLLATLVVPDESGPLKLTVSTLPFSGEWEEFLLPNVTRWLRQLGLAPLSSQAVAGLAKKADTQSGPATVLELAGVMSPSGRGNPRNPHAGVQMPPASSTQDPPASPSQELTYKQPEDWLPGKLSSMRKASFLLPGGRPADNVAVTSFSARSPQMAEVSANVRRWAGQVGMPALEDAEIESLTEEITISGLEGTYVELTSPEQAPPRAIYVAMVKRQGMVWFFKMDGKPALVSSQRAAFREFLESVRFP